MQVYYKNNDDYDRKLKTGKYSSLRYYSKKVMKKKYTKGGYLILGGLGSGLAKKHGRLYHKDKQYDYYTLHYAKLRYGIDGYIDCGNDQYIAVLKSRIARNLCIVFITLLLLITLLWSIFILMNNSYMDPDAKDYTPKNSLKVDMDPNHIALPGYGDIKIKAGTDTAYIALWNPTTNPCYFKFTIKLKKDDSIIYQSKMIKPGKAITEVKFDRTFDKGEYDISIQIDTFSLDDKDKALNGGSIETKIIAINTNK